MILISNNAECNCKQTLDSELEDQTGPSKKIHMVWFTVNI